ncbi:MAG: hypothetical protein H7306_03840 [Bacteriovorax sp.]|nr:hypothetical protein [Rhizobacter sp.]
MNDAKSKLNAPADCPEIIHRQVDIGAESESLNCLPKAPYFLGWEMN